MPYEADKKHLTTAMWLLLFEIANDRRSTASTRGTEAAVLRRGLITDGRGGRPVLTARGADMVRRAEALKIEEEA